MKIVVGSESAIKLRAVRAAFEAAGISIETVTGVAVDSGVNRQPFGTDQMVIGARERVRNSCAAHPGADYYIGVENGLVHQNGRYFDSACVVVRNAEEVESIAFGAYFPIPDWMAQRTMALNSELGEIVKALAGGGEKDPMKYLSQDAIPREKLLADAVLCALVPLINKKRYEEH